MSSAGGSGDETPEFVALLESSREQLATLTEAHRNPWRLGEEERWDFDQDDGILRFAFADGAWARAPAQVIGTLNGRDGTWVWACDNPSIEEALRADSRAVRAYGEAHRIDRLTLRKLAASEDDAWTMTALAVRLCGAQGADRGPAGSASVFFTFGQVELGRPGTAD